MSMTAANSAARKVSITQAVAFHQQQVLQIARACEEEMELAALFQQLTEENQVAAFPSFRNQLSAILDRKVKQIYLLQAALSDVGDI